MRLVFEAIARSLKGVAADGLAAVNIPASQKAENDSGGGLTRALDALTALTALALRSFCAIQRSKITLAREVAIWKDREAVRFYFAETIEKIQLRF